MLLGNVKTTPGYMLHLANEASALTLKQWGAQL
jgi:hypothetical protein